MPGISRSSVTTSGRKLAIFRRATAPSSAVATTSTSGSRREQRRQQLPHHRRVVHHEHADAASLRHDTILHGKGGPIDGQDVEDEHQRASHGRRPGHQRCADPGIVHRLDHELLFPQELVHQDPEASLPPAAGRSRSSRRARAPSWPSRRRMRTRPSTSSRKRNTSRAPTRLHGQLARPRDLDHGGERDGESRWPDAKQQGLDDGDRQGYPDAEGRSDARRGLDPHRALERFDPLAHDVQADAPSRDLVHLRRGGEPVPEDELQGVGVREGGRFRGGRSTPSLSRGRAPHPGVPRGRRR